MKICISSTFTDLIDYRNIAIEVCEIFKAKQLVMELMFSKSETPLEASLDLVRNCDIYICIIGKRYGTIPAGYDKSITNLEYEEALKLSKPIHIFIVDNLSREDKLQKFINDISLKYVYGNVRNINEFRSKFINTLRQNYFKDLKIDSKFLIDLETEHFALNYHGLALDFISNKSTLEILDIFSKNITGLNALLDDVSSSYDRLEEDLKELMSKLGYDLTKLDLLHYTENPFINRDWETINLGFPNWINNIKLAFLNLQVRILEYEVQRDDNSENLKALESAKKDLIKFMEKKYVD
ncbi:DUF4062 domain-containing protein [Aliarcobacter cryaerophilus]|uniref:DUF4062 domain-containing protein n=1 Tax=Aliarcobacter cryaerophilus TaxID=28198 RepID=UPI00112F0BCA|nr:DUF4062 domain-containing protein [Aliarcobacter cryaerophilus]